MCAFIGLNPSTADEDKDDPTVRRCIRYANSWGYGGLYMLNAFAWRATDPEEMKAANNPVGVSNDSTIQKYAARSEIVVAAWGNHGSFLNRSNEIKKLVPGLKCLGITQSGEPRHPLYLRADVSPTPLPI